MAKRVLIYGLVDPRDDKVRYVGQTVCIFDRSHLGDGTKTIKTAWINDLKSQGLKPMKLIIDKCSKDIDPNDLERFYIEKYFSKALLFNVQPLSLTNKLRLQYGYKPYEMDLNNSGLSAQNYYNEFKNISCKSAGGFYTNTERVIIGMSHCSPKTPTGNG